MKPNPTYAVSLRVTPDEHRSLRAYAAAEAISLAEAVRRLARVGLQTEVARARTAA